MDRDRLLGRAIQAAYTGGQLALRYFNTSVATEMKADNTPVTVADWEAEREILKVLVEDSAIGFCGEEFGEHGNQSRRWIIDPVDATKNFIKGIPDWATLIALEEEGEITIGVAYVPARNEMWSAQKGKGSTKNGRPVEVSAISGLDQALLFHSSLRVLMKSRYWPSFQKLVLDTYRNRGAGDFSGHLNVAQGLGELYLEPSGLKPCDLAAISIIVREAGGRFTDIDGVETIYSGSSLSTNGHLHEAVLQVLREHATNPLST